MSRLSPITKYSSGGTVTGPNSPRTSPTPGGIPRSVNRLCQTTLEEACRRGADAIDIDLVADAYAGCRGERPEPARALGEVESEDPAAGVPVAEPPEPPAFAVAASGADIATAPNWRPSWAATCAGAATLLAVLGAVVAASTFVKLVP